MQFCGFGMQIGNYRAYATMPRNEFSTNCERTLQTRQLSCKGIARDLRVDCRSDDMKFRFLCSFCVSIHVFRA